ncbi:MAG: 16S rRNA (guanine(966)-N(2))-methyltransferase RsmD [Clostridia bacterium]|nr:16S rRNA (guanine(966)-N(2))-methyltransferase RsmD [Clostridia bacterium]
MRVITGTARGRRLETVPGNDIVRPTPEKIKEAIFSAIQFDIEGRRVLDLFAGCGQLGIEALSRGADSAVFVDVSDISLNVVKKNLTATNLECRATAVRSDYETFLARCNDTFDIAFLDPPYRAGLLEKALPLVAELMSSYGIIICEHPTYITLPSSVSGFEVTKNYRFGNIIVTVYKKGGNDE